MPIKRINIDVAGASGSAKVRPAHRGPAARLAADGPSHAGTSLPNTSALEAAKPAPIVLDTSLPMQAPAKPQKSIKPWTFARVLRWLGGGVGLAILLLVGWSAYTFAQFQNRIFVPLPPTATVAAQIPSPSPSVVVGQLMTPVALPVSPTPDRTKSLPAGRMNILVLGTDKRENDPDHYARSDTMLLANVDTISHTVKILSIPRDLIVDIPDYGKNKVNSAFLFGEYYPLPGGGQALAVQTISKFFNVPIDYYVAINFDGFRKVVDTVGGVDIDVPYSIDDFNYPSDDMGDPNGEMHVHFDEGMQHMDGKTALRYARTRHADNDFARNRRQLQIILAVRQKAMSLDLLPAIPKLVDDLGGMVQTNIPFDQQLGLVQLGYSMDASNVMTASIDSSMIVVDYTADGSEGFRLDEKLAQPMLDSFFGWDRATGEDASVEAEANATVKPGKGQKTVTVPTPTSPGSKSTTKKTAP